MRERLVRLRDGRVAKRRAQLGDRAHASRRARSGGMNYLDALRSALEALRANPTRSLLTTLGIIIGVAAVIIVVAIGSGAARARGLPHQEPGLEPPGHRAGRRHRRRRPPVRGRCPSDRGRHGRASPVRSRASSWPCRSSTAACRLVHAGNNWPTALYGVGPGFLAARDWQLAEGRDFEAGRVRERPRRGAARRRRSRNRLFGDADPIGPSDPGPECAV